MWDVRREMIKLISMHAVLMLALAPACQVLAAEPDGKAKSITPVIEIGFYLGAEDLSTTRFIPGTNDNVEAGGLLDFSLGFVKSMGAKHEFQTTLGFRFDGVNGPAGNVDWSRWVLEGKYFYRSRRFRAGLGATYHINPSHEIHLDAFPTVVTNFDNSLGYVAEVDYLMRHKYVGLKLTVIDYRSGKLTIDGGSIGLVYGFNFR